MADIDIGAELLEKIRKDFEEGCKNDKYVQLRLKKIADGTADFDDAARLSQMLGSRITVSISRYVKPENLPDGRLYYNIADTILNGTLKDNYDIINSVCADVQKNLDRRLGINIKPQKADFPAERVEDLAKFAAKQDLTREKAVSEFGAAVENLNACMFTDYIKVNADFRSKAGLKVYVIRSDHSGCCDWCAKLTGKYVYPDVPKDIWRRHKRCTCEIVYVNEKAGTYDRISYSDRKDGKKLVTNKQVTRLTPEQAAAKEKEVLTRLDKRRKSGIIKENIVIGNSVGAASKNYPVRLPSGNHAKIVEGTEITGIKTFAGKGTDVPIRVAKQLEDKYKIKAEKWEKVRGTAYIRENGTNRKVELHWYEADGERVEMKVKRYFDED